jgi:hypothetical protein
MVRNLVYFACIAAALCTAVFTPWQPEPPVAAAADIQVSRAQFAQYVDELSEPEGYFDSDNFITNETSYLHIIGELRERVKPGNVYLGVGPDQNFSYIAHTRPTLAIIVDIRRQNMLEHLLYKALFDLSASRVEFLSLLFSRETPRIDARSSLRDILIAIRRAGTSDNRYRSNLGAIRQRLDTYGIKLSAADFKKIEYIYSTLHEEGLDLRFSSIGRNNASQYPTFESLMLQTDRTARPQSFLSTEELFQWLKGFESENRLIPIVGDFAGRRAFKSVGSFLKRNALQVSTFYTSNVEFYIFAPNEWDRYIDNVRAMPWTADAVFIRSYFNGNGLHPLNVPGHRSTTLIHSVSQFLRNYDTGRMTSYWDVVSP